MLQNQDKYACPFNDGVTCLPYDEKRRVVERDCEACGWNPKVAKCRLKKMGITIKENKKAQES